MNARQKRKMIECWVKNLNPNAILRDADVRCGKRCAVYVVSEHDQYGIRCTDYLPIEQLEQYLMGVFHADDFNSKMGLSSKKETTSLTNLS